MPLETECARRDQHSYVILNRLLIDKAAIFDLLIFLPLR